MQLADLFHISDAIAQNTILASSFKKKREAKRIRFAPVKALTIFHNGMLYGVPITVQRVINIFANHLL